MDKNDMFAFFLELKNKYKDPEIENVKIFENYNISKLDIKRLYKYLTTYTQETVGEDIDDESVQ
jgi:hypothetical protein